MEPAFNINARKRPVNLTLNTELVERVKGHTDNLSATVEDLLAAWLEQRRLELLNRHRICAATATAWNAFNNDHGSIADEFSTL